MNTYPDDKVLALVQAARECEAQYDDDLFNAISALETSRGEQAATDRSCENSMEDVAKLINDGENEEAFKELRKIHGLVNRFVCQSCGNIYAEVTGFRCPKCGETVKVMVVVEKQTPPASRFAPFVPPFRYSHGCVTDSKNKMILEVRSWKYLKAESKDEAIKVQDRIGHAIAAAMNKETP